MYKVINITTIHR